MPNDSQTRPMETVTRPVRVLNELGLHARPAAKLAQEAQKFSADVVIKAGELSADAKSILDILSLAAAHGSDLELEARGSDADKALEHLEACFKARFEADSGEDEEKN